ncbi:MAG: RAMP superfamily CRISPR-associated protein [Bacteroidota bacterium]
MEDKTIKDVKYVARFKVETKTPMSIGSGNKGINVDRLIARDANGLPWIPGTALAGIVRHELNKKEEWAERIEKLFGYQNKNNKNGQGSRIIFGSAALVSSDGDKVHEGLEVIDFDSNEYYKSLQSLPERDHVRINERGTAVDHAKYLEELVPKGVRFVFEIEVEGATEDQELWDYMLHCLNHPSFSVGGGTRKGFGQLEIVDCLTRTYDLKNQEDLKAYLAKSSSLNSGFVGATKWNGNATDLDQWIHYQVSLQPENFFLFGAGVGDLEADNLPKKEQYFIWTNNKAELSEEQILIPATSVKGTISHRVAFHYNASKDVGYFIDDIGSPDLDKLQEKISLANSLNEVDFGTDLESVATLTSSDTVAQLISRIENMTVKQTSAWSNLQADMDEQAKVLSVEARKTGEDNEAVRALFGFAKEENGEEDKEDGARGKVIFSDVYLPMSESAEKILNHVAIDRFTGGGIDGALFQEKVVHTKAFTLDMYVEKSALQDATIKNAFESALDDLCHGRLQLGGNSTKGHGAFAGSFTIQS